MLMNWTHQIAPRIAAVGGATVLALALLGPAASAQQTSDPAQPTFDVKRVCDVRIPKLEAKANKVLGRINGGADTVGSVANLKARAEKARKAGNAAQADWLDGRAQHRTDRGELVKKTIGQLADYKQKHRGGK